MQGENAVILSVKDNLLVPVLPGTCGTRARPFHCNVMPPPASQLLAMALMDNMHGPGTISRNIKCELIMSILTPIVSYQLF